MLLVAGLKIIPARPRRRFIFLEALRQNYQFDKDVNLCYCDFEIPSHPKSRIKCYVHPQDVRSGWILDRVLTGNKSRPDLLLRFCRTAIEELSELKVLIDLGANYGEYYACSSGLCDYVGVEPNPIINKLLSKTAKNGIIINKAVIPNNGLDDDEIILSINPFYSGGSSLMKKNTNKILLGKNSYYNESNTLHIPIDGVRVDEIINKVAKLDSGFYIKIDIEGMDIDIVRDILKNGDARKSIIQMELNEEDLEYALVGIKKIVDSCISKNFRYIRLFHGVDDNLLTEMGNQKSDYKKFLLERSSPLSEVLEVLQSKKIRTKEYTYGELIIIGNDLMSTR